VTGNEELEGLVRSGRQAVLATINRDGRPQLSNVLYVWDEEAEIARISTTADRLKFRNLQRDPRCSLHVEGQHFWQFAVAAGEAELSEVATEPGDATTRELLLLHSAAAEEVVDEEPFFKLMIEQRRAVIRFRYSRVGGVFLADPP
jgi:PPOX class probable F420-dependent enzyme